MINNDEVLNLNLYTTKVRNKTVRNYMKVQDLFAKIGGFTNAIIIVINILTKNFLRFKYLEFIHKNTFQQIIDNNNNMKSMLISWDLKEKKNEFEKDESNYRNINDKGSANVQQLKQAISNNILNNSSSKIEQTPTLKTKVNNFFENSKNKNKSLISISNNLYLIDRLTTTINEGRTHENLEIAKILAFNLFGSLNINNNNVNNKKLSYVGFLSSQSCISLVNNQIKEFHKYAILQTTQLLDFITFKQFLIEQYIIKFSLQFGE